MNYLAPYVLWMDPPDPAFDEFTYGEHGRRSRRLLRNVHEGDYIFFHTTIHGQKVISAYFVVDRVIRTTDVQKDPRLMAKYHNPHLENDDPDETDVIVFGDPIVSKLLRRPLVFDKQLAKNLDLGIEFRTDRSETQSIGWACREWRELSRDRVEYLLGRIEDWEKESIGENTFFTSDEIAQILERDLENYIVREPQILGKGLRVVKRQMVTPTGRLDVLLEDRKGNPVVVELKLDMIGRDAVKQLKKYMRFIRQQTNKRVSGILVCRGIYPAFEEELSELDDISIFLYGWKMDIKKI